MGLRVGGWVCLGFPRFWGKCRYPPLGGGVRFFGCVGGLLILVDHQRCSWAEAVCWLCLCVKKHFLFQVSSAILKPHALPVPCDTPCPSRSSYAALPVPCGGPWSCLDIARYTARKASSAPYTAHCRAEGGAHTAPSHNPLAQHLHESPDVPTRLSLPGEAHCPSQMMWDPF